MKLDDVHNSVDHHEIPINHVGVTELRYPIVVLDQKEEQQKTVAKISMSVDLPHHFKGTHMSRKKLILVYLIKPK